MWHSGQNAQEKSINPLSMVLCTGMCVCWFFRLFCSHFALLFADLSSMEFQHNKCACIDHIKHFVNHTIVA